MPYCLLCSALAMLPKGVSFGQAGLKWRFDRVCSGQDNLDSTPMLGWYALQRTRQAAGGRDVLQAR